MPVSARSESVLVQSINIRREQRCSLRELHFQGMRTTEYNFTVGILKLGNTGRPMRRRSPLFFLRKRKRKIAYPDSFSERSGERQYSDVNSMRPWRRRKWQRKNGKAFPSNSPYRLCLERLSKADKIALADRTTSCWPHLELEISGRP